MIDLSVINTSLRGVLATLLGVTANTVRPANQNAPTGTQNQAFITVLVSEIDNIGVDASQITDQQIAHQLTEVVAGMRTITASVQFFRGPALSSASRLGSLLRSTAGISLLNRAGLGLQRVGKVTNVSQVVDTYQEQRAQIELELTAVSVEQAAVATFASVPVTIYNEQKSASTEVKLDS